MVQRVETPKPRPCRYNNVIKRLRFIRGETTRKAGDNSMTHAGRKTTVAAVIVPALVMFLPSTQTLANTNPAPATPPPAQTYTIPPPNPNHPFRTIKPGMFGQHIHNLNTLPAYTTQGVTFPAVRLWDNGVRWDQINTAPNTYKWQQLDNAVNTLRTHGTTKIMYVLAGTPEWAAPVTDQPNYMNAPGANYPATLKTWKKWVTKVTKRYGNRITDYQIWNEANLSSFWKGTPRQLADYTKTAAKIIHRNAPKSNIVTPSLLVRQGKLGDKQAAEGNTSFTIRYFKALKKIGVRNKTIDKVGVHSYPWIHSDPGSSDPQARLNGLKIFKKAASRYGFKKPLSDTEVGYGNRRANGWPHNILDEEKAAGYLAQTYLQSLALGVVDTYWYGWDDHVLGVDLTTPPTNPTQNLPSETVAGEMFLSMIQKLVGAQIGECVFPTEIDSPLTQVGRCTIRWEGIPDTYILVWSTTPNTTVEKPVGTVGIEPLNTSPSLDVPQLEEANNQTNETNVVPLEPKIGLSPVLFDLR